MDTGSILRSLGIKDLNNVPMAPNYPYAISLAFSALAAGSSVTVQDVCQRSKTFVLDDVTGAAWVDSAVSVTSAITSLTDSSGGTASDTIAAVPGAYTQATLANQIASLAAKVNALNTALGVAASYPARSLLGETADLNLPSLAALSVVFFSTRGDWASAAVPWPALVGTARMPRIPLFKPVLAGGNTIGCRITNNGTVTVSGAIVLNGRYLSESGQG